MGKRLQKLRCAPAQTTYCLHDRYNSANEYHDRNNDAEGGSNDRTVMWITVMMETMMITTALMTEKLMQIAAMTDTMWLALPS